MSKSISITVFANILISIYSLGAQNSNCTIPEEIAKGKLTMEVVDNKFTNGTKGSVLTYFKMASKSNELKTRQIGLTAKALCPMVPKFLLLKFCRLKVCPMD